MILNSFVRYFGFKRLCPVIYLSSHLNKAYGSINKPINQFGQKTKSIDSKQSIR